MLVQVPRKVFLRIHEVHDRGKQSADLDAGFSVRVPHRFCGGLTKVARLGRAAGTIFQPLTSSKTMGIAA